MNKWLYHEVFYILFITFITVRLSDATLSFTKLSVCVVYCPAASTRGRYRMVVVSGACSYTDFRKTNRRKTDSLNSAC